MYHKVREIVDEIVKRYDCKSIEIWLADPIGNIADIIIDDSKSLDEDLLFLIFKLEKEYGAKIQDILEEELRKRGIEVTFNI